MLAYMQIFKQSIPVCFAMFLIFCAHGCGTAKRSDIKNDEQFEYNSEISIYELPKRLISDYSDMQEDDTVSWFWIKTGFGMNLCRTVKIYPMKNYSQTEYPWAEEKLETALKEIFNPIEGNQQGKIDIGVMAAIVEMKPKLGIIKRFFPSIDAYPNIEIEIAIFEETSKTILLKLCHFKKGKDFEEALHGIIQDLEVFFTKKI